MTRADLISLDEAEAVSGEGAGFVACPGCGVAFTPKRKNQSYCEPPCQKRTTRNAARGSRNATDSQEVRHTKRRNRGRLFWLNETFYCTPPGERLGLLMAWLNKARGGNTHLSIVLANPAFFAPPKDQRRKVSFRRSRAYPPVPFLADRLCRRLLGCRVWQWVDGSANEPETGEVMGAVNPPSTIRRDDAGQLCTDRPVTVYVAQDPADFLAGIRALREAKDRAAA